MHTLAAEKVHCLTQNVWPGKILSLPMYPQLHHDQQKRVVETIQEFCEHRPAVSSTSR